MAITTTKCDSCIHMKMHHTGMDEYPPLTKIPYCAKDHWHDDPDLCDPGAVYDNDEDPWKDCLDYSMKLEAQKS